MKFKIALISIVSIISIGLLILLILLRLDTEEKVTNEEIIPVKVQIIKQQEYEEKLSYVGAVTSDSIQTLGFKSPGKIEEIMVEVGDQVDEDTLLVRLSTDDLAFDVRASESTLAAAKAQYNLAVKGTSSEDIEVAKLMMDKAAKVSDFKKATLDEITQLSLDGVISNKELEGTKLEADIAHIDYANAKTLYNKALGGLKQEEIDVYFSQYEQAKVNHEYKQSLMTDTQLYATTKGTVVDILYEENELVPLGYPVIELDYINLKRTEGMSIIEACKNASVIRFRPIILSTITTISGLLPLLMSNSELFKPMATSLVFGLLVSTMLTLVFIPLTYSIFIKEDISKDSGVIL